MIGRVTLGCAAFLGAWLLAFSPAGRAPCGGAEPGIELVEAACADAAFAVACGQRCDAEGAQCVDRVVKKEEPCFKACKPTKEEAKKIKTLTDDKCMTKCVDKIQPGMKTCYATRAACRGKCP